MSERRVWEAAVDERGVGRRVDQWLASQEGLDLSRSYVQKLLSEQKITVNGKSAKASQRLQLDDRVKVEIPAPEPSRLEPEPIPLDIVFQDEEILVINKPAGLVVHPAPGNRAGTLVNALLAHTGPLPVLNGEQRPGIVHRIDKDTSGLLVVARTERAFRFLAGQFRRHDLLRVYLAIVHGQPEVDRGTVDAPLGRDPSNRKRQAVLPAKGRKAVTHFSVLERFSDCALVELKLETGRTHQIRVHMRFIGHPVLGDPIYGPRKNRFQLRRQALHAQTLGFRHPDGRWLEFHAPLPEDMQHILDLLRAEQAQ